MTDRAEYGEGSITRHHVPGCPHRADRNGPCKCRWRGTVEAGWTEKGTRRRRTVTGRTEAEARRRKAKLLADVRNAEASATRPDARRVTVAAWGAEWLEMRKDVARPNTWASNRTTVRKYLSPTIGRVRLAELTPAHLRKVDTVARRSGTAAADKVRRDTLKMLRDALAEGLAVPTNLFEAARTPRHGRRTKPRRAALEIPQAVAVLAEAVKHPDYARWVTGFYQGQRQGQTLGLTWDDGVDMGRGLITLSWQLQPLPYNVAHDTTSGFRVPRDYEARHLVGRFHLVRPKTDAAWRVTPMTEEMHDALTTWLQSWTENPHGLIWARDDGWPIDKAADAERFRALQVAANVRKGQERDEKTGAMVDVFYTGHEMRNTCATILVTAGVDPATITAILGHSSWSTSLSYATAQLEHMAAALKGVNAAYQPRELG